METIVIVVTVIALFIYLNFLRDPSHVREACQGKTPDQIKVIRYFLEEGCMSRNTMSDAEYDAFVQKALPDLRQRGIDKIGLDEDQLKEIDPVHLEGFVFDKSCYVKQGDDKLWRSSKYQVSWLFFSDTQVYLYQKTMSFDEKKEIERTEEYFYKDITNFSTISESEEVKVIGKNGKYETRDVNTTQFKLVVPGDSFTCPMEQNDYTESSIQGMKSKLREKKQQ